MRIPNAWLREYCDPELSVAGLAERLTMSGIKVERIERVGAPASDGNLELIRVGRVLRRSAHPDADRLSVCEVELGEPQARTIVCGAPNVEEGQLVAVALPGAVLPGGVKLKRAELRGVTSDGMILSEAEVELGVEAGSIMVLPEDYEVGRELGRYLAPGDDVLELEVTPNRPDIASVYGVAREAHAVTGAPLAAEPWAEDVKGKGKKAEAYASVEVLDPDLCPRFTARVFTEVQVGPSPLWLKARLVAAGQRPISNVVDITNYVMLLTGQPLHAFDLDRVGGRQIVVRRAREGETLSTLDGELRAFDSEVLLVCDAERPSGIAGIMGGADSEVTDGTTTILMEAATWNGPNVLRTSAKLGLRTEASARFEKQLHPALGMWGQTVAARLLVELCGAKLAPGTIDIAEPPPEPHRVLLRTARVERLLGEPIDADESEEILERLGFGVRRDEADLGVEVPPHRHYDVHREADLIEEVARVHGLELLPSTLPARQAAVGGLTAKQRLRRRAEDALRDRGLDEIVSWSFISAEALDQLRLPPEDERRRALFLTNPLSEDQAVMRPSLLPGLLQAARANLATHADAVRLFESGRVFRSNGQDKLPDERHQLGVLLAGDFREASWRSPAQAADFHAAKGLLQALLEDLRLEWRLADGGPAFLHPGRAAEVLCHGRESGWIGEIHPLVARAHDLDHLATPPVGFTLDLDELLEAVPEVVAFEEFPAYPAVYEDLAVVVDDEVEAQSVVEVVRQGAGEWLVRTTIFDVYRGEQLGEGKKSIALRLEFRSPEQTLTDEDVAAVRAKITQALARELGATLRE